MRKFVAASFAALALTCMLIGFAPADNKAQPCSSNAEKSTLGYTCVIWNLSGDGGPPYQYLCDYYASAQCVNPSVDTLVGEHDPVPQDCHEECILTVTRQPFRGLPAKVPVDYEHRFPAPFAQFTEKLGDPIYIEFKAEVELGKPVTIKAKTQSYAIDVGRKRGRASKKRAIYLAFEVERFPDRDGDGMEDPADQKYAAGSVDRLEPVGEKSYAFRIKGQPLQILGLAAVRP